MTRAEVLESLKPYPANILHVGNDGVVKLSKFIEWLHAFMVIGSDKKIFQCDGPSFSSIEALADSQLAGFRWIGGERPLMTPFGFASVDQNEHYVGVTVVDLAAEKVLMQRPSIAEGLAYSETINQIAA